MEVPNMSFDQWNKSFGGDGEDDDWDNEDVDSD